ncbi:MAG: hypothetical protein QXO40_05760 [Candidatus Aenigmatarchaeota archaeon]
MTDELFDKNGEILFYDGYELGKNGVLIYTGFDVIVGVIYGNRKKELEQLVNEVSKKFNCIVYPKPNGVFIVGGNTSGFVEAVRQIVYA